MMAAGKFADISVIELLVSARRDRGDGARSAVSWPVFDRRAVRGAGVSNVSGEMERYSPHFQFKLVAARLCVVSIMIDLGCNVFLIASSFFIFSGGLPEKRVNFPKRLS